MPRPTRLRQETETTPTVRQPRSLQRHRTIERPRLFALLDESNAPIRTLVAPAGYGKTTLAEQWVARDGRRWAWFTARRSSTDVAALALGIARASTALVSDCDARLREHLRAVPASADNIDVLAEILGEDLCSWPQAGWLVLDDYHEIARGADAERFVAALVGNAPIQVLIASRQRPSWVATRGILYGEVLELNQTALAMDPIEAADVLANQSAQSASGLVALANGWPAVIGLASVSGAEIDGDVEQVPESLYRFFAEEVYSSLDEGVQAGLATLSIAPLLDREVAGRLLEPDLAEATCAAGLDVGVIAERGSQLELHPLCRSFLEERSEHLGLLRDVASIERCLDHYHERRDWDAAFELIARHGAVQRLETLVPDALDELLETARLSTIEAWCEFAAEAKSDHPVFLLARAETRLRRGRYAEAQAHAEAAAEEASGLAFRALSVAGRAAHLASQEEEGFALYQRAEAAASNEAERRDALWGQLRCQIELELPEAPSSLEELAAGIGFADAREVVRTAGHRLFLQIKFGSLDLAEADRAHQLVAACRDPLVESSFQSVYSAALALAARYQESLEAATDLLATSERYRLDFAVPYAQFSAALAYAGLRNWERSRSSIDEAMAFARANRDVHAAQLAYALQVRILAQQGLHQTGLAIEMPSLQFSLPAARAEVLSSRALVLASAGRVGEALALVADVRGSTRAVEPTVLIAAVDAVCAVKSRSRNAVEKTRELEAQAFDSGAVDLLVTTYRANADILTLLLRISEDRDRLAALIRRVGDEDLAATVGQPVAIDTDPRERLSPREREVYELLLQGISDLEIASVLFISRSTVKVHTHRIYDKLGLRSRTALAIQAALERGGQATSATAIDSTEDGP